MTIYEVKQKAIDALGEVDISKLGVYDARTYCEALHFLSEIKEPDNTYFEQMQSMMDKLSEVKEMPKPATLNDLK